MDSGGDLSGYTFGPFERVTLDDPVFDSKDRRDRFVERLRSGHRFFGFKMDGRVAAYFWFSISCVVPLSLGAKAEIPTGAGYIWDCRTAPEFRGRGLYASGLRLLVDVNRAEGRSLTLIACDADNVASRKGIDKAGFVQSACWEIQRIGPLRFARKDSGAWQNVSLSRVIVL